MGLFDFFKKRPTAVPEAPLPREPLPAEVVAELEKTRRPFIRVSIDQTPVELSPTTSKLGGIPYRPLGSPAPAPESFIFVAQLNFAELPTLEGMPLPTQGLVQFWIADDDTFGLYDADRSSGTHGHRVAFYDRIDEPQEATTAGHCGRGPLSFDDPRGHRLRFMLDSEVVGSSDYAWQSFRSRVPLIDRRDLNPYDADGHKIGGYCAFTQVDPREPSDPMLSLLQLDGDSMLGWGDAGIAHWFIREADLVARDFAKTVWYWDCC